MLSDQQIPQSYYISRLNSVYDTRPREYLLSTIFKEMRQGNTTISDIKDSPYRTLAEVTERARELRYERGNKPAYDIIKKGMPQFTPATVLETRSDIKSFSNLVCLEWDGDVDTAYAFVIGTQNPNVLAIWRSLSGNPKFLVPIAPISQEGNPLTTKNFRHAWYTVSCMFEEIGDTDTSAMNPTQSQALCYDPDIFVNYDALPVKWDVDEYAFKERYPNLITPENLAYAELPVQYHIAIQEMQWKPDGWGKTRVSCPWGSHENDGWASRSNATTIHKNGENDFTFHCFKCPDTPQKRFSEVPLIDADASESIERIIENAPPPIDIHTPSFPHWTPEERIVVKEILGLSPDAGWKPEGVPAFATRYENLHKITGEFTLNGQPSEIEKRRVWSTEFGKCEKCGDVTADWVDRYHLTAGRYCTSCHTDTPLGSYLEWELARKLPNSIISEYQGYLGDDPEFQDFRLWQPEMLTHLGAGMSTGKSTEICKAIVSLARQKLGVGIIASPFISLARFLAHQLRKRHGRSKWGLWHEGSGRSEQFIGSYGTIVCLPSLGRAVSAAYAEGLEPSDLYLAIDEIDFGYSLLSLAVHQAAAVKKCLLDIFLATGLVVSGQTESTLALEAFAAELGCDHVQGFYNTAPPADGFVEMRKYPDVDGKNALVLAGAIESIEAALAEDHNLYVFCSSRRDADVIAERFPEYNPVCYNAYTKGDPRCDAVLKNQRLPEGSRLFIGTSAAGVGISILDPKAKTIRVGGLNHGSRDARTGVQTTLRDRGRRGIEWHFVDYNFALPVRPHETERVSLYHEEVKQRENQYAHLSENAVKKIARSTALDTLADHQLVPFVQHHLGEVGNMEVVETQALLPDDSGVEWVTEQRRNALKNERESKCELAVSYLTNRKLLTSRNIRVKSNQNELTKSEQLAHEYANGLACAVGWNDADDVLENTDIEVAIAIAEQNVQPERLEKLRRGYLAVHYPSWVTYVFQRELEDTVDDAVELGVGVELTAVRDERFLGEVLKALINRLKDEVFNDVSLATAIREVLDTVSHGQTLFGRIKQGGLGAQAYRRARFLKTAGDAYVIRWARMFIKEFYPATLSKRGDCYSLVHDKRISLILASFQCWLSHRVAGEVPELEAGFEEIEPQSELKTRVRERRKDGAMLETIAAEFDISLGKASEWCRDIDPKVNLKEKVRERREHGQTLETIATEFNLDRDTVQNWCDEIEVLSPTETDVMGLLENRQVWKTSDLVGQSKFSRQAVTIALNNLLENKSVTKIKRGYYQKSSF